MSVKPIQYKGRKYKSLRDLYDRFSDIAKVGFSTFCGRIARGWDAGRAIEKPKPRCICLTYNGVKYNSAQNLYKEEKRKIRASRHRRPAIGYPKFIEIVKAEGVSVAVKHMRLWHLHCKKDRGYKSRSIELGGADNLVCQRMTKLGWSREKAESTPRCTKSLPIKVYYKGNRYPSITACFNSVAPEMSIVKFAEYLRKHNFKIT